jgi:hypothetical protein
MVVSMARIENARADQTRFIERTRLTLSGPVPVDGVVDICELIKGPERVV